MHHQRILHGDVLGRGSEELGPTENVFILFFCCFPPRKKKKKRTKNLEKTNKQLGHVIAQDKREKLKNSECAVIVGECFEGNN